MIKKTLLPFYLLTLTLTVLGQTKSDAEQIKDLIQNSFDDLWSAVNLDKIPQYYSNDFMLLENGAIWNMDSVLHVLNKRRQRTDRPQRINKIHVIKIDVDGKHADVSYWNEATFVFIDKPSRLVKWLESAALKKVNDVWRIHLLHSTPLPPPKK